MKYLIFSTLSLFLLYSCSTAKTEKKDIPPKESVVMEGPSDLGAYQIQSGDTYMWIAYKLYGDHTRWRELAELNPDMVAENLEVGGFISYNPPPTPFNWTEIGLEYRIQRGDTLGKISRKVYGSPSFWRDIQNNNSKMIRNPDRIFAGFILFYKRKGSLAVTEVAR